VKWIIWKGIGNDKLSTRFRRRELRDDGIAMISWSKKLASFHLRTRIIVNGYSDNADKDFSGGAGDKIW
jgi:hypothetical protein